jgi:hypothetical protein
VKVRQIVRGPRATFDLKPRARRRREYLAARRLRAQLDPQRLDRPAITLTFLLRLLRSAKWQKRQERRRQNSKAYYRWFDKRYRQVKLGVRKEIQVVPKW